MLLFLFLTCLFGCWMGKEKVREFQAWSKWSWLFVWPETKWWLLSYQLRSAETPELTVLNFCVPCGCSFPVEGTYLCSLLPAYLTEAHLPELSSAEWYWSQVKGCWEALGFFSLNHKCLEWQCKVQFSLLNVLHWQDSKLAMSSKAKYVSYC